MKKGDNMNKQYYLLRDTLFHYNEIWHGESERADFLLNLGKPFIIIPLGTRKPRNVSRETIKEF